MLKAFQFIGIAAPACLVCAAPAQATETVTYTYDELGRLTKLVTSGSVNNGETVTIVVDKTANRTTYTITGA